LALNELLYKKRAQKTLMKLSQEDRNTLNGWAVEKIDHLATLQFKNDSLTT